MIFTAICPKCKDSVRVDRNAVMIPGDVAYIEDVCCNHCKHSFDVALEIEVTVSAHEIELVKCDRCGESVRSRYTYSSKELKGEIKGDPYKRLCFSCLATLVDGEQINRSDYIRGSNRKS